MTKTMKFHAAAAALFFLCSCDAWLDVDPVSNIPSDNFYKTPTEAEQALIGVYSGLLPIPEYTWHMCELRADHIWNGQAEESNAQKDYFDIFTYNPNLAITGMINDAWLAYYKIISRANLLIEKMAETDFDDNSEVDLKSSWEAEARVLRAFSYFDLVRYFGRIPIVLATQTVDEAMATRQSESIDVYNNVIIPDLEFAIEHLDETAYNCDGEPAGSGRVNKIVAQALLGRVYATMAGFPINDKSKTDLALEQLKAVVDYADANGKYWAEDGRKWQEMWLSDNDNKYHIWEIQYVAKENYGNPMVYWMIPKVDSDYIDLRMSGYNLPASDNLIALFETDTDGDGISNDVRRIATINYEGSSTIRFITKFFENKISRARLGYADNTSQVVTRSYFPINFPLIRLEDVMLLYAELAGPTPTAISYVNRIRTRAGIGELDEAGIAGFAQSVDDERARELAGEGIRWHDIVRRGTWQQLVKDKFIHYSTDASGDITIPRIYDYTLRVTDGTYLYPIPDTQMKVKEGLYEQNEAYR